MLKAQLQSLSVEAHTSILSRCARQDLRALRLASKYWHALATVHIFSDIVVRPHVDSLERLIRISTSDRLRHLVKSLFYDGTILTSIYHAIQHSLNQQISGTEVAQAIRKHGTVVDNMSLLRYLTHAFSGLCNLKHITVRDESYDGSAIQLEDAADELQQSIEEAYEMTSSELLIPCGEHRWSSCFTSHICAIIAALPSLSHSIQSLDLDGFFWSRLLCTSKSTPRNDVPGASFAKLKHLHLNPAPESISLASVTIPDLQNVLRAATCLETCRVNFGGPQYGTGTVPVSIFSLQHLPPSFHFNTSTDTSARLTWSSVITELDITGMVCTLTELQSVLWHCRNSLQSLSLSELTLVPDTPKSSHPCLVAMLKWIRQHLSLREVKLNGSFSNCGLQQWDITTDDDSSPSPSNLYTRVMQFLLKEEGSGPCPLGHVAIKPDHFDFRMPTRHSSIDEDILDTWNNKDDTNSLHGDDTWRMTYQVIDVEETSSDEEYTEDSDFEIYDADEEDVAIDGVSWTEAPLQIAW